MPTPTCLSRKTSASPQRRRPPQIRSGAAVSLSPCCSTHIEAAGLQLSPVESFHSSAWAVFVSLEANRAALSFRCGSNELTCRATSLLAAALNPLRVSQTSLRRARFQGLWRCRYKTQLQRIQNKFREAAAVHVDELRAALKQQRDQVARLDWQKQLLLKQVGFASCCGTAVPTSGGAAVAFLSC